MPVVHRLERSQRIARPLSEVFAFFSNARNLEAITPPFLRFQIVTPSPIEMREGACIEYRISLWGVPLGWHTRIALWQPNERFVDEQTDGPYAYWHHLHEFQADGDATRMRDELDYALPFGPLGSLAHALWVKRQLRTIFDYRATAIERLLPAEGGAQPNTSRSPEHP
jgi:ligand-binding SRPBCC domain-containing protein